MVYSISLSWWNIGNIWTPATRKNYFKKFVAVSRKRIKHKKIQTIFDYQLTNYFERSSEQRRQLLNPLRWPILFLRLCGESKFHFTTLPSPDAAPHTLNHSSRKFNFLVCQTYDETSLTWWKFEGIVRERKDLAFFPRSFFTFHFDNNDFLSHAIKGVCC